MALRKERQIQQQMAKMQLGAQEAKQNYVSASERKLQQLHANMQASSKFESTASMQASVNMIDVENEGYNRNNE